MQFQRPKSSSAAGCTRRWLGNTSTVIKCAFRHSKTVLVLPSQRCVHPAGDDDFVECRNAHLMTVLVLPNRCGVRPAGDDDFVKDLKKLSNILCHQKSLFYFVCIYKMNTFDLFTAEAWKKSDVEVIKYGGETWINQKHL